ncbi:hypothetical protein [Nocardiopsis akebiae]|nr:hypothetical protein [Nocardiopsis akebiae]
MAVPVWANSVSRAITSSVSLETTAAAVFSPLTVVRWDWATSTAA